MARGAVHNLCVQLAREGKTVREITALARLNDSLVRQHLRNAGVKAKRVAAPAHSASAIRRVGELYAAGMTTNDIAEQFDLTKNAIIGIINRHHPDLVETKDDRPVRNVFDRCDALHARMDAVLAETRGIGRIANVPKLPRGER
jgi:hypothetical protein